MNIKLNIYKYNNNKFFFNFLKKKIYFKFKINFFKYTIFNSIIKNKILFVLNFNLLNVIKKKKIFKKLTFLKKNPFFFKKVNFLNILMKKNNDVILKKIFFYIFDKNQFFFIKKLNLIDMRLNFDNYLLIFFFFFIYYYENNIINYFFLRFKIFLNKISLLNFNVFKKMNKFVIINEFIHFFKNKILFLRKIKFKKTINNKLLVYYSFFKKKKKNLLDLNFSFISNKFYKFSKIYLKYNLYFFRKKYLKKKNKYFLKFKKYNKFYVGFKFLNKFYKNIYIKKYIYFHYKLKLLLNIFIKKLYNFFIKILFLKKKYLFLKRKINIFLKKKYLFKKKALLYNIFYKKYYINKYLQNFHYQSLFVKKYINTLVLYKNKKEEFKKDRFSASLKVKRRFRYFKISNKNQNCKVYLKKSLNNLFITLVLMPIGFVLASYSGGLLKTLVRRADRSSLYSIRQLGKLASLKLYQSNIKIITFYPRLDCLQIRKIIKIIFNSFKILTKIPFTKIYLYRPVIRNGIRQKKLPRK